MNGLSRLREEDLGVDACICFPQPSQRGVWVFQKTAAQPLFLETCVWANPAPQILMSTMNNLTRQLSFLLPQKFYEQPEYCFLMTHEVGIPSLGVQLWIPGLWKWKRLPSLGRWRTVAELVAAPKNPESCGLQNSWWAVAIGGSIREIDVGQVPWGHLVLDNTPVHPVPVRA